MQEKIDLRRSKRRTIAVEITQDAKVIVRAPMRMPQRDIDLFLKNHMDWIADHLQKAQIKQKNRAMVPKLTEAEMKMLKTKAKVILSRKMEEYAKQMGIKYTKLTIRFQKSRWGSCSATGSINLNALLMLTPDEVQDYVVVHELSHRRQMNHSELFWREVEGVLPDYRDRRKWLADHGSGIIARLP